MKKRLPGDLSPEEDMQRMIRVDHAGEYGAMRIYAGQLAFTQDKEAKKLIQHMADQEKEHLDAFEKLIAERRVRPTALMPLWHVAGYALGAATALLGKEAAMACTVAVEEVIDAHYKNQHERLEDNEQPLKNMIAKFRTDEQQHRNTGLEHEAEKAPCYPLLHKAVGNATRLAIWLSTRI